MALGVVARTTFIPSLFFIETAPLDHNVNHTTADLNFKVYERWPVSNHCSE
jgi:hypothetical protein